MPSFLGIDYGEKRIGLSHGDELGFAFALEAAIQPDAEARFNHIGEAIRRHRATELVVGYPLRLDGTRSRTTDAADAFIAELEKRFSLPVHRVDEGLSSAAASDMLGKRKPRSPQERREQARSGQLDSRAAQIILQDFLNSRGYGMTPPELDGPEA